MILATVFDISNKKEKLIEFEEISKREDFWSDKQLSQEIFSKLSRIKNDLQDYNRLEDILSDIDVLLDILEESFDSEVALEIEKYASDFLKKYEITYTNAILSGEYDNSSAIVTLHSGAGGTESCDWTDMLYRMYLRWSSEKGFKVTTLDYLEGDGAGIKSVTFEVKGKNAYGYLKCEQGVHRLVRISPFNANGKRQTSFSSLEVIPMIEKDIEIEIPDEDLKIDTFRASGAGGQHINKTESAIRITHLPTNIVVSCQSERSQHMNKKKALDMLKSKLLIIKEEKHLEKISDIKGIQKSNGFGSQIRSYVLQPYTMVKDHRTNIEVTNASKVLDGDIDAFINGYLMINNKKKKNG